MKCLTYPHRHFFNVSDQGGVYPCACGQKPNERQQREALEREGALTRRRITSCSECGSARLDPCPEDPGSQKCRACGHVQPEFTS